MKANEKHLVRFLESPDVNFVIPVYQRNYNWKKEQCEQLFNDLVSVAKNDLTNHFFGTVVCIYNINGHNREYLIIDGQQRTTTISLLLLAIYNVLKEGNLDAKLNKDRIFNQYLFNQYLDDEAKVKLKLIKEDSYALKKIFANEDFIIDSNVTLNYQYFYERILTQEISIDALYAAIEKLMIVEIELKNGEDDPQLIFESLNSTGLDLTDADKVRNFILMGEVSEIQERFYDEYWYKIEKNTEYNVTLFLRDYLTMKENRITNINKIYMSFKNYVSGEEKGIEEHLKDILKFSKYYKKILNNDLGNEQASEIIKRINKLEVTVVNPFLIELLDDYENKIVSDDELVEVLSVIEIYIFRRIVCKIATNALNKIFMNLQKEIKSIENYKEQYVEVLKFILLNKKNSQRVPTNEEFKRNFFTNDFYNMKNKNKLYLLERLENFNNREKVDIENLLENNILTIEHIMPQKLTQSWKESLGKNHLEIHEKYLNTIGNLTLTGYNSSYSNKPFSEKKNAENGLSQSRLRLNKFASQTDEWKENDIINRATELYDLSQVIWPYYETKYICGKRNNNIFTLADDEDFTGIKVKKIKFKKQSKEVKSWTDLFKIICIKIYEYDKAGMYRFMGKEKMSSRNSRASDVKTDLREAFELDKNIFLELNMSTLTKLDVLRVIFDEYELDYNELEFETE